MNNIKRAISFLITFVLIFSLAGCFDPSKMTEKKSIEPVNENNYKPVEDIKFNLPYINGDYIDPFKAQTETNQNLTSLLYDSLYEIGNDFKAVPLIAESCKIQGNSLVVTIKSGLTFSDGTFVTVTDVVHSFEQAKECERYKHELSVFQSAEVTSAHDVTFTFESQRSDMMNLLTFPVIKVDSSELAENNDTQQTTYYSSTTGTDENNGINIFDAPIGSGRYYLTKDDNNIYYLCCNTKRLGGYFPTYRNIGLIGTADTEKINSLYSLGRINVVSDTYDSGEYTQIIGNTSKITMSNFIYLALNSSNIALQDPIVKKAISYALDRKELCDYSFIGNAYATELPFHPNYYKTAKIKPENNTFNDAVKLLESNGYDQINPKYNFRYSSGETTKILEFRLAVCKNNAFKISAARKIKEQLAKANIRVELYEYYENDFFNVISLGSYDMYLGETKLSNNLDLTSFFTSGNSLSSGISSSSDTALAYTEYKTDCIDAEAFINTFKEDLPFIPLLYRNGNIYSNSLLAEPDNSIVTDKYHNIDNWKTEND